MKEGTRVARSNEGTTFGDINNHDEIPSNLQKDFIRNNLNKDTLYQFLAERLIDLHFHTTQILVVTYKDAILKTQDVPAGDINSYKYEEADARVIRYLISVSFAECLTLLLFIHLIQMFCYFVWFILIIVNWEVQHVLFSVRLAWFLVERSTISM